MTEKQSTAYHEAAPAVVDYRLGLPIEKVTIDEKVIQKEPDHDSWIGFVSFAVQVDLDALLYLVDILEDDENALLRQYVHSRMMASLAGPAMDDLNELDQTKAGDIFEGGGEADFDAIILLCEGLFGLTFDITTQYEQAKALVRESLPAIHVLEEELQRRLTLTGSDVASIIEGLVPEPKQTEIAHKVNEIVEREKALEAELRRKYGLPPIRKPSKKDTE